MFQFTEDQLIASDSARNAERFADAYDLVVRFATDENGNPLPGVNPAALIWFEGAADVNRGRGAFSDFIREYTSAQFQTRFGGDALSQSELQGASNSIAIAVLADVLSSRSVPSAFDLGLNDASVVAATFFKADEAGWSGVPLFVALGESSFYRNNILERPGETYDLMVLVDSFFEAAGSTNIDGEGRRLWDTATDLVSVGAVGSSFKAAAETLSFLKEAYGGFSGLLTLAEIANRSVLGRIVGSPSRCG